MYDSTDNTTPRYSMSADNRRAFRAAITSHPSWDAYRIAHNLNIASMSSEDMIKAAIALGIDPAQYGTLKTGTNSHWKGKWDGQPKPRPYGSDVYMRLCNDWARVQRNEHTTISRKDIDLFASISSTILNKQESCLTEGQYKCLSGIIQKYQEQAQKNNGQQAYGQESSRANEETTTTATQSETSTHNQESSMYDNTTTETATESKPPRRSTGSFDDMIRVVIEDVIGGTDIAAIVQREIKHAMSGVPTVVLKVQDRMGDTREVKGHKHPKFQALLRACTSRKPDGYVPNIWMSGPTGSGKTHAVQQVADALGLPLHVHGATDMAHELLGFIDAAGTYHRTPFREAFEHGGLTVLDEIDRFGNPAVLCTNSMLSNHIGTFPDGKVTRHKDCIVIGTANTWGIGATADYVGAAKLDAAFLARFNVRLDWQYDTALEIAISGNQAWAERVIAARHRAREAGLKVVISPRISQDGAALIAAGFTMQEAAELTYLANLSVDQRKIVEGTA